MPRAVIRVSAVYELHKSISRARDGRAGRRGHGARQLPGAGRRPAWRERSAHRAVGNGDRGAGARQRGADGGGASAARSDGQDFGAVQGHGQSGDLSGRDAPGRHGGGRPGAGRRSVARLHFPDDARGEDRGAAVRSARPAVRPFDAGLRGIHAYQAAAVVKADQRTAVVHRPHRFRQDEHDVFVTVLHRAAGRNDGEPQFRGGPGGVQPVAGEPDAD